MEPPKPPQASGFRRLVVTLAIVAAVGAGAVLVRDAKERPARGPGDPGPPAALPRDDGDGTPPLARVDSTKKNEWVDELPNADLAGLPPGRVEAFLRFANARRCTCGCGFTLAACQRFDPSCEVSGPLVSALLDSVRRGLVADARGLRERPRPGGR